MSDHPALNPRATQIEVAAGLVFRKSKLLIAQRFPDAHCGGLWEFPGGKREPGETFEQCLQRELIEELGMEVHVCELVEELKHDYPDKSVLLKFFRCEWTQHEPRPIHCQNVAWVTCDELSHYTFPAADARLIEKLVAAKNYWKSLK
jgi:8-oxo-dGTP diphosphatase